VFTWVLPEDGLSPGHYVTLRVWEKKYQQLRVDYGGTEWVDSDTDYGQTVVPVGAPS
jgi:hypothetical protein